MKFPTKYTVALQILCICYLYKNQKITSNFIAERTGADPSIIRYTMLDLKKKNYISSKPGPGGTTLSSNLADISLYDVYELVADPEESVLKFYELPSTSTSIDLYILDSTKHIFDIVKAEVFSKMKATSVLDLCKDIS